MFWGGAVRPMIVVWRERLLFCLLATAYSIPLNSISVNARPKLKVA
jgi:hypothetical protein